MTDNIEFKLELRRKFIDKQAQRKRERAAQILAAKIFTSQVTCRLPIEEGLKLLGEDFHVQVLKSCGIRSPTSQDKLRRNYRTRFTHLLEPSGPRPIASALPRAN